MHCICESHLTYRHETCFGDKSHIQCRTSTPNSVGFETKMSRIRQDHSTAQRNTGLRLHVYDMTPRNGPGLTWMLLRQAPRRPTWLACWRIRTCYTANPKRPSRQGHRRASDRPARPDPTAAPVRRRMQSIRSMPKTRASTRRHASSAYTHRKRTKHRHPTPSAKRSLLHFISPAAGKEGT